ncbi:hypothetical protein TGGT1_260205 [Toxoplasma gondii GT1]|uniref:Uncharacterized protein n=4 Tax=Toxoplasma gondii TaxID=5811 RepID=A0A125YZE0_TOXGV|nr:hypothetical protein TGGT1_260205 [Toxoplasma gondii GT1]ESS32033.1 hypothetical protein TGVEG_260205 [Toxoplasma gondii VEG]KAF4641205.1 hypothetical protein TGRH88_070150 [Toxoplasma gondii]PIM05250.1 hypothetical protein TGCOUG_260205 [Toxoplasma gondii COUG]
MRQGDTHSMSAWGSSPPFTFFCIFSIVTSAGRSQQSRLFSFRLFVSAFSTLSASSRPSQTLLSSACLLSFILNHYWVSV